MGTPSVIVLALLNGMLFMSFNLTSALVLNVTINESIGFYYHWDVSSPSLMNVTWVSSLRVPLKLYVNGTDISYVSGDRTMGFSFIPLRNAFKLYLTLENVSNLYHGEIWYCQAGSFPHPTEKITIFVKVPISSANITSPVTSQDEVEVIESVPILFECETSAGRPQATIQWYKYYETMTSVPIQAANTSSVAIGTLVKTRSTLSYVPSRNDTGYRVFCTAYNMNSSSIFESALRPQLYVLYPPSSIVLRYDSDDGPIINSSIRVIKGDSFRIYCKADGNPVPTLSWNNFKDGDMVTYKRIHEDSFGTCTATNKMRPTGADSVSGLVAANVSIEVLYGPSAPTFTYHYHTKRSSRIPWYKITINVLNGTSFKIECDRSDSKPPSKYYWSGFITSLSSVLTVDNIDRTNSWNQLVCTAYNTMERTHGSAENGTTQRVLYLNVLYAPIVHSLSDDIALENTTYYKYCHYTKGSPTETDVQLTRVKDNAIVSGNVLTFSNVSRDVAGVYRFTANNTMPLIGTGLVYGVDSKNFTLTVHYAASITAFTLNSESEKGPYTFDESSTILMTCTVDSNPGSRIAISRDGRNLKITENANTAVHVVNRASCFDAGLYACSATNDYNSNNLTITRHVNVLCPPRPDTSVNNYTYYADLYGSVTMTLQFAAYPAQFSHKWYKQESAATWREITSGVSSNDQQSNLSLDDINQHDFGTYKVQIINPLGILEELFFVTSRAKPDNAIYIQVGTIVGAVSGSIAAVIIAVVLVVTLRKYHWLTGLVDLPNRFRKRETDIGLYENASMSTRPNNITASLPADDERTNTISYENVTRSSSQPGVYEDVEHSADLTVQAGDERNEYEVIRHVSSRNRKYESLKIEAVDPKTLDTKVYENLRLT